ncbi:MAG: ATP-dependent DNA helicase RecG [Bacteroidia bacterium]|nr:ATP-dependent DNA helicase RecG [Bacteroidia bacterium]
MQRSFLDTPIEFLKGVGPMRAEALKKELRIFTFDDLLNLFPFRYVDRTKFYRISEINEDMPYVQLRGKISHGELVGEGRAKRYVARFTDGFDTIELVWFQGWRWMQGKFSAGTEYIVFGKPTAFNRKFNMAHPEVEAVNEDNLKLNSALQAVYPSTETLKNKGLDSNGIRRLQTTLVSQLNNHLTETLPDYLVKENNFVPKEEAVKQIHFPTGNAELAKARARLKFEELFYLQLKLLKQKTIRSATTRGFVFSKVGDYFNNFYKDHLPFPLTGAQKRVVKEIRVDAGSGKQMNRLLQGDVGSGKTMVAMLSMLIALDNGYQACIMAPTEILANQHFVSLTETLGPLGLHIKLLTGSTKVKERRKIHADLLSGELQILVGTHALIEDIVQFKNLGLAVIDEQHRFGVAQRAKLRDKNKLGGNNNALAPHILIMTATPIPRTLAMTLYGDLDVSVIDEMPPGRKPIKTTHMTDNQRLRMFGFMKEQIALGRQIYVVYPLIQESEKLDYKNLMEGFDSIEREFPLPKYQISIVHGKQDAQRKEMEMQRFVKGQTQIMVATTVIEVGVNVPNASVMVIESTERFGLSQLHQLRGRVGRGAEQSFCVLMSSFKLSKESQIRIETMCRTNDGFEIADVDMKLRGPGDIEGTQQSGILNLKIADLSQDVKILQDARIIASKILDEDPDFQKPENFILSKQLEEQSKGKTVWSKVG